MNLQPIAPTATPQGSSRRPRQNQAHNQVNRRLLHSMQKPVRPAQGYTQYQPRPQATPYSLQPQSQPNAQPQPTRNFGSAIDAQVMPAQRAAAKTASNRRFLQKNRRKQQTTDVTSTDSSRFQSVGARRHAHVRIDSRSNTLDANGDEIHATGKISNATVSTSDSDDVSERSSSTSAVKHSDQYWDRFDTCRTSSGAAHDATTL